MVRYWTIGFVWLACFCLGWSAHSRPPHRQLWSPAEDTSVSEVFGALSALDALCNNVVYKRKLT